MSLLYFFKLMQHIAPCKSLLAHIPSSPPLVQLSPSQPSYEEAMHRTRLLLEIENTSKIFSSRGRGNSTRTRTRIHTRPCSSHYSPEKIGALLVSVYHRATTREAHGYTSAKAIGEKATPCR